MKRIGIFGTSGFAREAADVAIENGYVPTYIARDAAERDAWSFDWQVIVEGESALLGDDAAFAIGIGENAVRQRVWERHRALRFVSLIHPSATFGAGQRAVVEAQSGVIVCAGVRFTNNIEVGRFSIFNLNVTVGHDAVIGAFANLSPGVNVSGNVAIGERCWIGTGAAINQGALNAKLVIGSDTVIGSGSVVVRECEPDSIYVGIPARKIKLKTLIIAEAGVNHNGDLERARRLVHSAAAAGCDLVKFQSFVTAKSIGRDAPKAQYQIDATGASESQFEMVRKLELSRTDHEDLVAECRRHSIGFFSTAFDEESFDMLLDLGLDRVKVPSGEITNLPLLRHFARSRLPVILSTGMATLGDIEAALEALEAAGAPADQITLLHCNTEYPTPMPDVNLRAMQTLRDAFALPVGYSDHTAGIEVPIAAVALGACVIEKHFTLDRTLPGPDHQASLEPDELGAMVKAIRNIEQAMGDGIKRPSPSEARNRAIARKSLVAARAIRAGEPFSALNVTAKRPGTGLSPMRWDEVMGRKAGRDFAADEPLEL